MKAYVVECPLGVFGLNAKGRVVEKALFTLNPEDVAWKLSKVQTGLVIGEVKIVLKALRKGGYKKFVFENDALAKSVERELKFSVEVEVPSEVFEKFRQKIESYAVEFDAVKDSMEFRSFLHDVTMQMAKVAVSAAAAKRDLHAVQAVRAIDDLDKTLNLFAGRIREWYGLHFPELDRLVDKHDTYTRLVSMLSHRSKFELKKLEEADIPLEKAKTIAEAAKRSMGAEVKNEDLQYLRELCEGTLTLFKLREKMEEYVKATMEEAAPNTTAILGPVLAARLVSIAGSVENLAKMPASTIQVLGAEKALFRSLRTGTNPPKHGIIFQYAPIHQSPKWQRGKIARTLSGRLAIAARLDAFGGKFAGETLKQHVERRIAEVREKYKKPSVSAKHVRGRRG